MLPNNKKGLPELLRNPVSLIRNVRRVVELHFCDDQELAITGIPSITCKCLTNLLIFCSQKLQL